MTTLSQLRHVLENWDTHKKGDFDMKTIAMIMAGGKGSRLTPLTCHRAKPAVPFGGRYRIIDFVLSNFVNSVIAIFIFSHSTCRVL